MAEKGQSSDEEPTIAEDVVVTKYKMAGDMANREPVAASPGVRGRETLLLCRMSQPFGSLLVFTYKLHLMPMQWIRIRWNLSNTDTLGPMKLIREVSSFQGANITHIYEVGTWSSVLITEVSLIQGCPLTLYRP